MNFLDTFFQHKRQQGQVAFLPFLTAGDPDLATTRRLIVELAKLGAGPIEIGFPYSDPIADGPVIQASYTRALSGGLRIDQVFQAIAEVSSDPEFQQHRVPLVAMASYSLIFRRGQEAFIDRAIESGFSGVIVPDLPFEESGELARIAAARDFCLIQLVTPTTEKERASRIVAASTGFVYCVSVTGITGERDRLPGSLLDQLAWLRTQTTLPLCVGFGVSKPEHVAMLKPAVDGVIVGSAIVRRLADAATRPTAGIVDEIKAYVQELMAPIR